jgi:hypothetical protein
MDFTGSDHLPTETPLDSVLFFEMRTPQFMGFNGHVFETFWANPRWWLVVRGTRRSAAIRVKQIGRHRKTLRK